jgi:hypothetical protein
MSKIHLIIASLASLALTSTALPVKVSQPIAITQESTLGYIRDSYEPIVEETRFQMPPYPFEAPDFNQGFKPIQQAPAVPQYHTIPNAEYYGELPINSEIYPATSLQVPQKDSFDFYSSSYLQNTDDYPDKLDAEMEAMQKLQPPPLPQVSEIDYYLVKPRKHNPKKYTAGKMHVYVKNQKSGFKMTSDNKDATNPINDQYFQDPIFKINEHLEPPALVAVDDDDHEKQQDVVVDQEEPKQEAAETTVNDGKNQDSTIDASSGSPAIPEKKIVTSGMNKEIETVM